VRRRLTVEANKPQARCFRVGRARANWSHHVQKTKTSVFTAVSAPSAVRRQPGICKKFELLLPYAGQTSCSNQPK